MSGPFNKLATPFVRADSSRVKDNAWRGEGTVPIKRADSLALPGAKVITLIVLSFAFLLLRNRAVTQYKMLLLKDLFPQWRSIRKKMEYFLKKKKTLHSFNLYRFDTQVTVLIKVRSSFSNHGQTVYTEDIQN